MLRLILVVFTLCVGMAAVPALAQDADGYTLNAGDSIRVHVYGETDLSFEKLLIGQNGRVNADQ